MGHPGVALRDLEASRDALSREADINPNPQKGGYPAPNRVPSLTGAYRDFPKWRRQGYLAITDLSPSPTTEQEFMYARRTCIGCPGRY